MMKAHKKRKFIIRWWVWIILILGGVLLMMIAYKLLQSERPNPITTIQTYYETKAGLLRVYPERDEFLSESMGQYLIYLETVENQALFEQAYQSTKRHFVEQSFIKWRTTDTTVDAIIDTFRIIEAFKRVATTFDQPMYLEEASNYQDALKEAHYQNGFYVDFFDWYYEDTPPTVHLSYQNIPILTDMSADLTNYNRLFSEAKYDPFFNEVYNVETKTAVVDYESMAVNGLFLEYLLLTNENSLAKDVYKKLDRQIKEVHEKNYQDVHVFDYLMAVQAVVDYEGENN